MRPFLALLPLMLPVVAGAAGIQVGETAPMLSLKDQHDQVRTTLSASRFLLFSADKDGANLADDILEGQTGEMLERTGLCYVADISKMPSMVTKMFAMPKLRKRPYPVLLGRTDTDTATLPRRSGKVTLIELSGGSVTAIEFLDDVLAARARLGFTN